MQSGAEPSRLPAVVQAMLRADFYPHRPASVELRQTHISYVLLAGSEVYKIKKPVRFAFLDFSTLERRRHFCREEVRLNRRLAGDVYRGVVAIRADAEGFAVAGEDAADAVEYAVHLRRLPDDRMLPALLERGAVDDALIDAIVRKLAAFHAAAETSPEIARGGDPAVLAQLMDDDFREVDAFHGDTITAEDDLTIRRFCHAFLGSHESLLRRRQSGGRIRDGHGDLHAEHICCTAELVIYDCIEFNPQFRQRDVAAEMAFLAMDFVYRGRPDLAERLIARYAALANDAELPGLVPFYACHRAYIRGKVDSLKSTEPEIEATDRAAARGSAIDHFALAYRYTWAYSPRLVVVVGLSGSGKSTLAAALQARTGFVHVNSDVTRKHLAGLPPTARAGAELYTPARSAATYGAMYAAAADALAAGRGAILDGTFQRRIDRDAARAVASHAGVPVLFVECVLPADAVRARLAERGRDGRDASDADWAVYQQQRERYQPFAPDEVAERLVADTRRSSDDLIREIEPRLR
jgi:aminoglycoside phosphotransferase family enzyme/predicted kinase